MSIDWLLTAILTVAGSLILSIAGNLLTNPIKNWLAERSIISKKKRIEQLRRELEGTREFYQNKEELYLHLSQSVLSALMFICIGLVSFAILAILLAGMDTGKPPSSIISESRSPFWEIIRLVFMLLFFCVLGFSFIEGVLTFLSSTRLVKRIRFFDKYAEAIQLQISEIETSTSKRHHRG